MEFATARLRFIVLTFLALFVSSFFVSYTLIKNTLAETTSLVIYDDKLNNGFVNWSWDAGVNFDFSDSVGSGTRSISVSANPWGGLYFYTDTALDTSSFSDLSFAIRASRENQKFAIIVYDENKQAIGTSIPLENNGGFPPVGQWKTYNIALSNLNMANRKIKGFAIQEASGGQSDFLVDDVRLYGEKAAPLATSIDSSVVFSDSLNPFWENWSWGTAVNFDISNPVSAGSKSIGFAPDAWGALYFHTKTSFNTSSFTTLSFSLHATADNQKFAIMVFDPSGQPIGGATSMDKLGGNPTKGSWKKYEIALSSLNITNRDINGVAVQEISGQKQPEIYIDEVKFTKDQKVSSQPTASQSPVGGYTVQNNKIFKDGQEIRLKGVSWFGFDTGTHVVHGLWARNWKDQIIQMKGLGFNAVRIPLCPASIKGTNVESVEYSKNPDLANLNSLQILDRLIGELNTQQMFVLLDHHTPDCSAISDLWYTGGYSETDWIDDLKFLAGRYKDKEYLVGWDIKNEPHNGATWGTGNQSTDWNLAAERAGKAVLSVNPNILIFVQGVQNNPVCTSSDSHFWGGNLEPAKCKGISTGSIPSQKLVFSPHVYGPDVHDQHYFNEANFPSNMPEVWNRHFGFLGDSGATIVPGEWGGKFGNGGGSQKDLTLQGLLMDFYKSKHICNSFYWSWNPNSTDTGGILQDDWITSWSNKVSLVTGYFNSCN